MMDRKMTEEYVEAFRRHLYREEKSPVTIQKYYRDIGLFAQYAQEKSVNKELTVAYKGWLQERNYAVRSINSMLASLNSFLRFMGWEDCLVKTLRCQREAYCSEEKELSKEEYRRLLEVSRSHPQLHMVIQTICGTGIRVSELRYFTIESIRRGEVTVQCKAKTRTILIPSKLRKMLLVYAAKRGVVSGAIFATRHGNPLDRSNIWSQMKTLCQEARVSASKVFPHNLRKLFARTFYEMERDIAKLADVLGHGSIETTRIYIMTTGKEHRKTIDRMGLIT